MVHFFRVCLSYRKNTWYIADKLMQFIHTVIWSLNQISTYLFAYLNLCHFTVILLLMKNHKEGLTKKIIICLILTWPSSSEVWRWGPGVGLSFLWLATTMENHSPVDTGCRQGGKYFSWLLATENKCFDNGDNDINHFNHYRFYHDSDNYRWCQPDKCITGCAWDKDCGDTGDDGGPLSLSLCVCFPWSQVILHSGLYVDWWEFVWARSWDTHESVSIFIRVTLSLVWFVCLFVHYAFL